MRIKRGLEEQPSHHPWSVLDTAEVIAAIASWLIAVAAAFVIILVDTWLGIALVALALVAYFAVSILHIGNSRRRVAAQLTDFERRKRGQQS
jgi:membrane protein YdbS with pleckstrin-like domain